MLSTDSTAKPFYRAPLNRQSWSTTTPNICRAVKVCRALRVEAPRHTPDLCRALRLNLHGTIQTFSVCFFQTTRHTLNLCRAFFPDCTAHSEPFDMPRCFALRMYGAAAAAERRRLRCRGRGGCISAQSCRDGSMVCVPLGLASYRISICRSCVK